MTRGTAPSRQTRLTALAPGWTAHADVVVVGSGIAGLTCALRLRAEQPQARIRVVTKDLLDAGSTRWAQGGIAAALGPGDTPAQHEQDTLVAGAGVCSPEAVRVLVSEGPAAVRELIGFGARFDHDPDGALSLTREGGHHRDRIAHAGGDATGAEIQRALVEAVRRNPGIEVVEHALVLDLLRDGAGAVTGLTLHVMGEGQHDGVGAILAPAVVLASGGFGQVFSATTNPAVATGDGVAMALRAGAVLRDLEFVQFHPTVMWLGPAARGQQPLISEAVRGEGAYLIDVAGRRFMTEEHPLADLAPRDVVAKAITRRIRESGRPQVWLEARHLGEEFWERRFPTILATCRSHGVDPVAEPIPVVPAQHYASGGVATDLWGRTSIPGLYATGEVACSGVHGANRLASNSLLEGLVFSRRIARVVGERLSGDCDQSAEPADRAELAEQLERAEQFEREAAVAPVPDPGLRSRVQQTMTDQVGVIRTADGLAAARATLAADAEAAADGVPAGAPRADGPEVGTEAWESSNLLTVARAVAAAAELRRETRGTHWREDHPGADPAWVGHVEVWQDGDGLQTRFAPSEGVRR